jgi:hypothetical protein
MGDGMALQPVDRGAPAAGVAPVGPAHAEPPRRAWEPAHDIRVVGGEEQVEDGGEAELLRLRAVVDSLDEAGEVRHRHRGGVDGVRRQLDPVPWQLAVTRVVVAVCVAHGE